MGFRAAKNSAVNVAVLIMDGGCDGEMTIVLSIAVFLAESLGKDHTQVFIFNVFLLT